MAPIRERDLLLSVIAALHNEEACLPELLARLDKAVARARCRAEFILVDDGSTDASFEVIEDLASRDARVRGVRLSQNEGHQAALLCGMDVARGDVVITLDADLQHPPELIPAMLSEWRRGFDVVHMRRSRSERRGPVRAGLASAFYLLYNAISDTRVLPGSTDFRLLDRECVGALVGFRRSHRFLRATVRRIGFRQTELTFESPARFAGSSSYTIRKLFGLAADAVLSSSRLPALAPLLPGAATGRPLYFVDRTVGAGFDGPNSALETPQSRTDAREAPPVADARIETAPPCERRLH